MERRRAISRRLAVVLSDRGHAVVPFPIFLLLENEEVPGVPIEDVQDVSNYVAALSHGLKRIREGFPLSQRFIREIHEILLSCERGSNQGTR